MLDFQFLCKQRRTFQKPKEDFCSVNTPNTSSLLKYSSQNVHINLKCIDLFIHPAVASPILSMITLLALSVHSSSSAQGPGKRK